MNSLCVATYLVQDNLGGTHQNIGHKENNKCVCPEFCKHSITASFLSF